MANQPATETISEPQKAASQLATEKPGISVAKKRKIKAFTTKEKRPRVKRFIGKVKRLSTGFITKKMKVKHTPTIKAT